jgi:hypothetical protein
LNGGAKHHAPDAAKAVDTQLDGHDSLLKWLNSMKLCYMISTKNMYFIYRYLRHGNKKSAQGRFV